MLKFDKWNNDAIFRGLAYERKNGLFESFPEELAYSQENIGGNGVPEIPLKSDMYGIYHLAVM